MTEKLSPEKREEVLSLVRDVTLALLRTAAPDIIEMIAAAKPNVRYTRVGDQCVIEPVDPLVGLEITTGTLVTGEEFQPLRDYRKQLWVTTYSDAHGAGHVDAAHRANQAVDAFDKAFPK